MCIRDSLKQIRVGPLSAGSEPGPAAYGLGGSLATVTDANILLGRISPETFGAEDIDLLPEESKKVLKKEHLLYPAAIKKIYN